MKQWSRSGRRRGVEGLVMRILWIIERSPAAAEPGAGGLHDTARDISPHQSRHTWHVTRVTKSSLIYFLTFNDKILINDLTLNAHNAHIPRILIVLLIKGSRDM